MAGKSYILDGFWEVRLKPGKVNKTIDSGRKQQATAESSQEQ